MISFMNQIVLQNMDYHSTPVDFDEKCATIFVDRLTNLTITFYHLGAIKEPCILQ